MGIRVHFISHITRRSVFSGLRDAGSVERRGLADLLRALEERLPRLRRIDIQGDAADHDVDELAALLLVQIGLTGQQELYPICFVRVWGEPRVLNILPIEL